MFFNSFEFGIFFPFVFVLYWFVFNSNYKIQNTFVFCASVFAYGYWSVSFLVPLLFSIIVDFCVGNFIYSATSKRKKKVGLYISLVVNLGLLAYFKYFNFFIESFVDAFSLFGINLSYHSLNIILPIGISFYTLQTLSYTIDIYRGKSKPTKDFIAFGAFVSFFPQLVAGPIERANNLLPQFERKRVFTYEQGVKGLKQFLWGLFKKIAIADACGYYVDIIFNDVSLYSGSTILLGTFLFTIQIYADFSGYSDMAIGISRLLGIRLKENFKYPFFSRSISEFWSRWHISLTSWIRDYLYFAIKPKRKTKVTKFKVVLWIFVISGFWHGAKWTFIFWGLIHAISFVPLIFRNGNIKYKFIVAENKSFPSLSELRKMVLTFGFVVITIVFFRAESMNHVYDSYCQIFSWSLFEIPFYPERRESFYLMILIFFFFIIEWIGRKEETPLFVFLNNTNFLLRWSFYIFLLFLICLMQHEERTFIYFQF